MRESEKVRCCELSWTGGPRSTNSMPGLSRLCWVGESIAI